MPLLAILGLVALGGIGVTAIALPLKNRLPKVTAWIKNLFGKKPTPSMPLDTYEAPLLKVKPAPKKISKKK